MSDYISYVVMKNGDIYSCGESNNMTGAILIGMANLMAVSRPDLMSQLECWPKAAIDKMKEYTELPKL